MSTTSKGGAGGAGAAGAGAGAGAGTGAGAGGAWGGREERGGGAAGGAGAGACGTSSSGCDGCASGCVNGGSGCASSSGCSGCSALRRLRRLLRQRGTRRQRAQDRQDEQTVHDHSPLLTGYSSSASPATPIDSGATAIGVISIASGAGTGSTTTASVLNGAIATGGTSMVLGGSAARTVRCVTAESRPYNPHWRGHRGPPGAVAPPPRRPVLPSWSGACRA